jgi:hypothetical protein
VIFGCAGARRCARKISGWHSNFTAPRSPRRRSPVR